MTIWQAGVEGVKPARLMQEKLCVDDTSIVFSGHRLDVRNASRLIVVGAGKASAAMAIAFENQVYRQLLHALPDLQLSGWINCPEGSFSEADESPRIRLFAARPSGVNEPTEMAVEGTQRILSMVEACEPNDLVVCLLSGGGSALLTAPAAGVSLADKQAVARLVSAAGGDIVQLNTIRRALSRVKAGGLARACRSQQLLTLVLSDVLGDSLETIASGPTYIETRGDPPAALQVLRELKLTSQPELANVRRHLESRQNEHIDTPDCHIVHSILGNNQDAVRHARLKAEQLGYRSHAHSASAGEGDVVAVARSLVQQLLPMMRAELPLCLISGGEPTVRLPVEHGLGGRNQQLALLVLSMLRDHGWPGTGDCHLAFVSGGTDGEDGPTPAAGAYFDKALSMRAQQLDLDAHSFLSRADAFHFFQPVGGLLQVGATGTNVCDLRVAVLAPK